MSFLAKQLRQIFSLPGVSDDREIDIVVSDAAGSDISIGNISGPESELGDDLLMRISLGSEFFLTSTDPNKITAPQWNPATFIGGFKNEWVLVELPNGADFGKFVPDGHASGKWYDASGNELKTWPNWSPLPTGSHPDPHLVKTPPEPPSAPVTVTILEPVSDEGALNGILMFALAKQDGFDLTSPIQPEWTQYEGRASAVLLALRNVDQLRSFFPNPVQQ